MSYLTKKAYRCFRKFIKKNFAKARTLHLSNPLIILFVRSFRRQSILASDIHCLSDCPLHWRWGFSICAPWKGGNCFRRSQPLMRCLHISKVLRKLLLLFGKVAFPRDSYGYTPNSSADEESSWRGCKLTRRCGRALSKRNDRWWHVPFHFWVKSIWVWWGHDGKYGVVYSSTCRVCKTLTVNSIIISAGLFLGSTQSQAHCLSGRWVSQR